MNSAVLVVGGRQDPAWLYPVALGGLAVIVAFFWLLDRVVTHFFPSTRNYHASVENALMRVEANFLPGREHTVEASECDAAKKTTKGSLL